MYPSLLERFAGFSELLREEGIVVLPKIFRGTIGLKRYPGAYTNHEREIILQYYAYAGESNALEGYPQDPRLDMKFIDGDLSFRGLLCRAGKDFVRITEDGNVLRCQGSGVKLGNVFHGKIRLLEDAKLCTARICPCPYYGLAYSEENYRILKQDNAEDKARLMAEKGLGMILNSLPKHPATFSLVNWLKRVLP
jgi:hypothetical protein